MSDSDTGMDLDDIREAEARAEGLDWARRARNRRKDKVEEIYARNELALLEDYLGLKAEPPRHAVCVGDLAERMSDLDSARRQLLEAIDDAHAEQVDLFVPEEDEPSLEEEVESRVTGVAHAELRKQVGEREALFAGGHSNYTQHMDELAESMPQMPPDRDDPSGMRGDFINEVASAAQREDNGFNIEKGTNNEGKQQERPKRP